MSDRPFNVDEFFEEMAQERELDPAERLVRAPARLKARLYSALVRHQEESGALLGLTETKRAGHKLCVFEHLWQQLPLREDAKRFNCCSICHARVVAERLEHAPIYWRHCPYVAFGKK